MRELFLKYSSSVHLEQCHSNAKVLVESGHYSASEAVAVVAKVEELTVEFELFYFAGKPLRVAHVLGAWIQIEDGFMCYYDKSQELVANPTCTSFRSLDLMDDYNEFGGAQILWLLGEKTHLLPAVYTVWVGGTEVTDNYVDYATALSIQQKWEALGYDDVRLDIPNASN